MRPGWGDAIPASPSDRLVIGGGGRNRTGVHGFAGRCITTLPPHLAVVLRTEAAVPGPQRRYKLRWFSGTENLCRDASKNGVIKT